MQENCLTQTLQMFTYGQESGLRLLEKVGVSGTRAIKRRVYNMNYTSKAYKWVLEWKNAVGRNKRLTAWAVDWGEDAGMLAGFSSEERAIEFHEYSDACFDHEHEKDMM